LSPKHTRLVLRAAVVAVLIAVLTHTRADPDLFGHVRFGRDIVSAASVRLVDPYSFASDRPWINHEWLAETIMYAAYAAAGSYGLVGLKLLLMIALLAPAVRALRRSALSDAAHDALLALLVVGTFPQANHVRPQLFSLVLFAWMLDILRRSDRQRTAALWCVPLFALWVNLHGGWIAGGAVLAAWTAAACAAAPRDAMRRRAIGIGAASLAATLCNPYGWKMWAFLYDTVGFGRADIIDWQPIFTAGLAYGLLWMLTALAAAAGLWHTFANRPTDETTHERDDVDLRAAVVVLLLGFASLRVGRILAFFTIAVVSLLGPSIAAFVQSLSSTRTRPERPVRRLAAGAVFAAALAVTLGAVSVSARNLSCIRMEPDLFPEAGVTAVVAQQRIQGRMLTWFDWGEYAIWYFAPSISVSMDGRRETVYSDQAIQRQLQFYAAPDERQRILAALQPAYIWMPSRLAVTARLIGDGWRPLFVGPQSTLLEKPELQRAAPAAPAAGSRVSAARCFPGP
jgi:hypothetical protein